MGGPTLPISCETHAAKYRGENESFEDGMWRIANALKDDEIHRREFETILCEMRFMPGGRIQAAMGAPKVVTPYNCFHRDTEIATDTGFVRLGDHVGETLQVLSPVSGSFHPAIVKTYGEQELFDVTISTSSKNDSRHETFTVHATRDHRWVLQSDEVTTALAVGHILKAGDCRISASKAGFTHGFVYGDGTKQREGKFLLRLCGEKQKHLRDILEGADTASVTYPPSNDGDPNVTILSDTDLKALPTGVDAAYLRGFVQGLLAADGCFKVRPQDAFVFSGTEKTVRWVRDHLVYAGYAPCGRAHEAATESTNFGERNVPIWRQLFRLSDEHKGYRVVSITSIGVDTVYCVEEPEHRQIVLRNGLRSGQCFVSGTIDDSLCDGTASIMARVTEAAQTMRLGGGIGYDFSTLRPENAIIKKLGSRSSGPISFMGIFDATCHTIASAGHRRGAQMGVLRVDHPDIMKFIHAKRDERSLTGFNISVAVTDEFMECLAKGKPFKLRFGGQIYAEVDPAELWDAIMQNTWDYAEPGVLFIDQINRMNNLWYCETIAATNPCFTGDTKVWTAEGHKTFSELAVTGKDVKVLTQTDDGRLVYRNMRRPRITQRQVALVKVTFDDGTSVRCTPHHKFYLRDGTGVEAAALSVGASIQSAYRYKANSKGYLRVSNGLVDPLEHHIPFENISGLGAEWHVHHRDEVKNNNAPDNLVLMRAGAHNAMHMRGDKNPMRRFPAKNWLIQQDHSGENNGRYREDIDDAVLAELRATGMSYAEIAQKMQCSKHTVMKRLGWNHKVVSVEHLNEVEDVYCGTVDETHKFFVALGDDDGVLVSNCGEQPLPPHGACLLGSFNLTRYVKKGTWDFDQLEKDIPQVVRAMDNVVDRAEYPLPQQGREARAKRRMGLGVTGLANAVEYMGSQYGSNTFVNTASEVMHFINRQAYLASVQLAKEKGVFAMFNAEHYLDSGFAKTLDQDVRRAIKKHGIRNSHLTSIAPTGTISLCADNVSSGIEPVFAHEYDRTINMPDGKRIETVTDYGVRVFKVKGKRAADVTPNEHVAVLIAAQANVDSAVSKTCNIGDDVSFDDFKSVYLNAYEGGAKGCTTFRAAGMRKGILNEKPAEEAEGGACKYDPTTGMRSCE